MILISHRGNINGPQRELENKPDYIENALKLGYDVEIDVWSVDRTFYLGHDKPQYEVSRWFLHNKNLWCHAKNIDAFYRMVDDEKIHCFSHDKDEVALTTKGYLWSHYREQMTNKSISVIPPKGYLISDVAGICSDYIGGYSE
jgi:hypothetical protein|tara:strand:+ start:66 stop:494 length:429 start_codon:yes stop_codon:yes gene_type:complete